MPIENQNTPDNFQAVFKPFLAKKIHKN